MVQNVIIMYFQSLRTASSNQHLIKEKLIANNSSRALRSSEKRKKQIIFSEGHLHIKHDQADKTTTKTTGHNKIHTTQVFFQTTDHGLSNQKL